MPPFDLILQRVAGALSWHDRNKAVTLFGAAELKNRSKPDGAVFVLMTCIANPVTTFAVNTACRVEGAMRKANAPLASSYRSKLPGPAVTSLPSCHLFTPACSKIICCADGPAPGSWR